MLTRVQLRVLEQMKNGSVIGEFSQKRNGLYELFTKKPNFKIESLRHSPFDVKTLNKNTFFALLELGLIKQDYFVGTAMSPFSRDCWYVYKDLQIQEKI